MKILALIPARGGTKRLPGKNIKLLGGIPLIAWTIKTALGSKVFCDVLVSTDDPSIADVARNHGAMVPWLRPDNLSNDTAASIDVVLHALDWYETTNLSVDGVMLLQPTSPFRSIDHIKEVVKKFHDSNGQSSVVSVSPSESHPAWCFRVRGDKVEPFMGWENLTRRSQDLEPAFVLNGSLYLSSSRQLRMHRAFLTRDTSAVILNEPWANTDIDTLNDWAKAEAYLKVGGFFKK